MTLERLWAGWRSSYVSNIPADDDGGCVLCRLVAAEDDEAALVLERTATTITVMNLYPYGSGHLMVAPIRHVASIEDLDDDEATELDARPSRARCERSERRTAPTASTSAPTSARPRVPAFPATCTSMCCRAGAATRTS